MDEPSAEQRQPGLAGKRVVVTGGGRGLGIAIARGFVDAGASVMVVGRNSADLERTAAALSERPGAVVTTCAADVSDPDQNDKIVDAICSNFGGLDVWVANAGISDRVVDIVKSDVDHWVRILGTNLHGTFYGCRAAARLMVDQGVGGSIIVTSSVLGTRSRRGLGAYAASKAGVESLVRTLALELGPHGITANAVVPGWFDSDLAEAWMRNPGLARAILGHTALGRWGQVDELVGAYLLLASDRGRFITGASIPVDGGYLAV